MNRGKRRRGVGGRCAETVLTKQQQVYETLRLEIETAVITPGERLNLRQLARRFGVSEIPVREAVKALEGQGLVQSTPFAGVVAAPVSLKEFEEVAEIRLALEPLGTRLAMPHLSRADLDELARFVAAMDDAIAAGEYARFGALDAAFHSRIFDRCPNARLRDLLSSLRAAANRNTVLFPRVPSHPPLSQVEHRELLAALASGDAERTEETARRHRQAVAARLRAALDQASPAAQSVQGGSRLGSG
jgi:DNA-binding GntR family transcriptional regulator